MQPQNALVVGHAGSRCLAQSCLAWSARRVAVRVSAVCDVRPSGGAKLLPVGAVLHGTFPGRPNDIASIDFQQNLFNPRVTGFVDDEIAAEGPCFQPGGNSRSQLQPQTGPGAADEAIHRLYVAPGPGSVRRGARSAVQYAWAVGVQFSMQFNDALGLPKFFPPD